MQNFAAITRKRMIGSFVISLDLELTMLVTDSVLFIKFIYLLFIVSWNNGNLLLGAVAGKRLWNEV